MKRELKCFATSVFKESYDVSDLFNVLFVSWEVALLLHVLNSNFKSFWKTKRILEWYRCFKNILKISFVYILMYSNVIIFFFFNVITIYTWGYWCPRWKNLEHILRLINLYTRVFYIVIHTIQLGRPFSVFWQSLYFMGNWDCHQHDYFVQSVSDFS